VKVSFEIKASTIHHIIVFILKGLLTFGLLFLFAMLLGIGWQVVMETRDAVYSHVGSATSLEMREYGIGFSYIAISLFPTYLMFKLWDKKVEP